MQKNKFILASKSPRRQELFKAITNDFDIIVKEVEEVYPAFLQSFEIPEYLSNLKSESFKDYVKGNPKAIVITADTMVVLKGQMLGKPNDAEQAKRMLKALSNNTHQVVTGVTILTQEKQTSFTEISNVIFDELSKSDIDAYVDNNQPLDKAGSYGIQESIGMIGIKRIEGCYYNIMGLPTNRLYNELKALKLI